MYDKTSSTHGHGFGCLINQQLTDLLSVVFNTVCRPSPLWHMHQHRSICLDLSYPVQPVHRMWLNGSSGCYVHIPHAACAER